MKTRELFSEFDGIYFEISSIAENPLWGGKLG
jgi:hypothetical protein